MPFKPGQSGNPKGRPKKGNTIRDVLREKLDKDAFTDVVIRLAMQGNEKAIRMVFAYTDGLPARMAADEGQVNDTAVILLPSNGREFSEAPDDIDSDGDEDGEGE